MIKNIGLEYLVAVALLASASPAQVWNDILGRRSVDVPAGRELLRLESSFTPGGATATLFVNGHAAGSASLPMTHVSGAVWVNANPAEWVICGTTAASPGGQRIGVLVRLRWSASAFSVQQSCQLTEHWPMSIAPAPGGLAMLDGKNREIKVASHALVQGGSLPGDGAWSTLANGAQIPEMLEPGYLSYMNLGVKDHNLFLMGSRGQHVSRRFSQVGTGLQLVESVDRQGTFDALVANGVDGFDVYFPAGCSTAVIRDADTQAVVATLSGTAGSRVATGPLAAVVQSPSKKLELYYPESEFHSHWIWPTVRYGEPLGLAELAVGRVVIEAVATAGSDAFAVACGARGLAAGTVSCVLAVAARPASGVDPVVTGLGPSGQQALLTPDATLLFSLDTGQVLDNFGKLVSLGTGTGVLLYQFVVVGPNGVGVSDVASTLVVAAPSANLASGPASQQSNQGGGVVSGSGSAVGQSSHPGFSAGSHLQSGAAASNPAWQVWRSAQQALGTTSAR